jgi:hypothetical protein
MRKIIKGSEKKFYLFNMSNSIQKLNFIYDNNKIEIVKDFEELKSGEYKEFKIKNKNIINEESIKINDISLEKFHKKTMPTSLLLIKIIKSKIAPKFQTIIILYI